LLELKSVDIAYDYLQVVWDVSLKINEGEIVAMLGLNGAGKTTTLKTIAGLIKPKAGYIGFLGQEITNTASHVILRKGLSFVPEERNLFTAMTVEDNLRIGAYTIKNKARIKSNLEYVYALFPILAQRRKQLSGTMSGGERQMLAIARGLMSNPKMIILDEPSMGLSPQNVLIVFETVKKLKEEKVTTFIVEQNVNTTLLISDRAYIMEHGRIVLEGESEKIRKDDNIRKLYLGMG